MTKNFIAALAAICVASLYIYPVWADSDPANSPSAASSPSTANPTSSAGSPSAASSTKAPGNWASLPKKTIAFLVGAVVGTPICAVRKSIDEAKDGTHGMVGETDKKQLIIPATLFWLPFAVVTGTLEAPCYAVINSLENADKPFSKEQFSLGEMKPE